MFILNTFSFSVIFQVRFDKLEGKNFLNKMEFLMASLSSPTA